MIATVALRFAVLYFGLFCFTSQIASMLLPIPGMELPDIDALPPIRPLVLWVARHLLRLQGEIPYAPSGSGDKTYDWVWMLLRVALAFFGAAIWSVLSRPGPDAVLRTPLYRWFCLLLRCGVGTQMLSYGFSKLVPLQMPFPSLSRLVEPFGNFSPMGVLWSSIGASPGYEMFLGLVEVVAGTLVLLPWTSAAGALLCCAASLQIFVLNLTYGIPVKLLSFHLLAMSLLIALPAVAGLLRIVHRVSRRSNAPELAWRGAVLCQCLFAAYWLIVQTHGAYGEWFEYGGGAPRPVLYGIWNIETQIADGRELPPLLTEAGRFRRVIFEEYAERAVLQRMDD
ncbi:MAG: hypothetical protein JNK48_23115, partial [Bryobacterales bacterium]|nr:hypothetical protein [Bryobacterales bacterium]